ncbi:hypothetical protein [Lysobacter sp. Root559]|uniref:hypothetical protein n=1 Tax=Lysobacter sp. Root559 TaxID=1736559 RepID=UPI000A7C1AF2|nr:hypothetical protein [Lysobacter sp. Root559]
MFVSDNSGYERLVNDAGKNFKPLRRTRHSHHPVDDAKANAEALLTMRSDMGPRIVL